jgi:hypothetical protein
LRSRQVMKLSFGRRKGKGTAEDAPGPAITGNHENPLGPRGVPA